MSGICYLIGAGPGDPGLLTLRAKELIQQADVIVYDYLCNPDILRWAKPKAELIFAGKMSGNATLKQEETNALLVEKCKQAKCVIRLKGGDPYIFGRGGEEAQYLVQHGIPFEIVPGVSSIAAVPAYAGIPITHRDHCSAFMVVTGHVDPKKGETILDYETLAQFNGTRILLMGVGKLKEITTKLIHYGANAQTPVAVIQWGTYPKQKSVSGTLSTIAELSTKANLSPPAVIVIGSVVQLREQLNWFEALPLFGQKVVVTRARRQASALSDRLRRLGAEVIEFPLIRILPPKDTEKFRNTVIQAKEYNWIVFTSTNGAQAFFDVYFETGKDIRELTNIKFAVVGHETAKVLNQLHLKTHLVPDEANTQGLIQTFGTFNLNDIRFLLIQGNLADPTLGNELVRKGAQVTTAEAYQTVPEIVSQEIQQRLVTENINWVTFTSTSTANYWHALNLNLPYTWKAVSIGPMTSKRLHELGYTQVYESKEPSLDSLIETIVHYSLSVS